MPGTNVETEYTEKMRGEGWEYILINLLIIFGVTVSGSNVVNLSLADFSLCPFYDIIKRIL